MFKQAILVFLLVGVVFNNGYGGFSEYNFDSSNNEADGTALQTAIDGVQQKYSNYKFIGVEKSYVQVVSGLRYKLIMKFEDESKSQRTLEVTVYFAPFENINKVEEIKEFVPGQPIKTDDASNQDPKIVETLVNACATAIKQRVNKDLTSYTEINSKQLSVQVVQGNIYTYRIDLTNPTNSQTSAYLCEIWSRPWLNPSFEVLKVSDYKPKLLTQEAGGKVYYTFDSANNVNDQKVLNALETYIQKFHNGAKITNIVVKSAQTQVVAGINFFLNIQYEVNGQTQSADAIVYQVPWRNTQEVVSFKPI